MTLGGLEIPAWLLTHILLSLGWQVLTVLLFTSIYGETSFNHGINFPNRRAMVYYLICGLGGIILLYPVSFWLGGL